MDLRHVVVPGQAFPDLLWDPGAVNRILGHSRLLVRRIIRIDEEVAAGDQEDKLLDALPDLRFQFLIGNTVYAL